MVLLSLAHLSAPVNATSRIVAVTLSRAGLSNITREFAVKAGTATYMVKDVPMAVEGSFWFRGLDGCEVEESRTQLGFSDAPHKEKLVAFGDILANNIGKRVTLQAPTLSGGVETIIGIVRAVSGPAIGLATIDQGKRLRAVRVGEIRSLDTAGLNLEALIHDQKPELSMTFQVHATKASRVQINSLEAGFAWLPTYRVTLEDDKNAEVEAKYQVASSNQRIANANVTLIASEVSMPSGRVADLSSGAYDLTSYLMRQGMPSLRPTDTERDPFRLWLQPRGQAQSPNAGYHYFGGSGRNGLIPEGISYITYDPNDNSTIVRADEVFPTGRGPNDPGNLRRLDDLYVIPGGLISLNPGDRVTRALFRAKVGYENYYLWETGTRVSSYGQIVTPSLHRKLKIATKERTPLPSGLCMVVKDGIPMAQVTLPFTAPQTPVDLDLGSVEDLPTDLTEQVVKQEPVTDPNGPRYIRQTMTANFSINNPRNEPIEVQVRFRYWGFPAGDFGQANEVFSSLPNNGNVGQLAIWKRTIPAGKIDKFAFTFVVRV